jgi:hypothetical protein
VVVLAAAMGPAPAQAGLVLESGPTLPVIQGFAFKPARSTVGIEPPGVPISRAECVTLPESFDSTRLKLDCAPGPQHWSDLALEGVWTAPREGEGSSAGFWLWGFGGGFGDEPRHTGGSAPSIAVPGSQLPVVPLPPAALLCAATAPVAAFAWRKRRRRLEA